MYIYQPDRALLAQQIKKAAHYVRGAVLDVGCGPHSRYEHLFTFESYMRMDIAPGDGVDIVGSADNIPAGDSSFDSVVSTQVFEHLEFPAESAREIFRVLKPGGYALITAPQWNETHEEPHDYWRYTRFGLESLFTRAGFEVIEMKKRGGYRATMAQTRIRYYLDRYHLHSRPLLGRLARYAFALYGKLAVWRDARDHSKANQKHAIGWCAVFQKPL